MTDTRVRLGQRGEDLAAHELVRRGFEIIERNWHCRLGEVDIVARRCEIWTMFEVRARRGRAYGTPEESVTATKLERMAEVARAYLAEHDVNVHEVDWRVGLVAVEMDKAGRLLRIDVYENLW